MNLPDTLKQKLTELPDEPGCYLLRNRNGRIIYVGKAASLRKRVRSYFRDATLRSATPKLRSLIKSTCDLDVMVVRNEAEALLTEGRLIKEYKPRYNVSFKDDKRFLLLRADEHEPYPRFRLCRIRRNDDAAYFGPYVSSQAARATLDFVEKRYGIRKCAPRIPDAETYRHCLNDIIRFCCAPCVGKVSREDYRARFQEACAFLRGEHPEVLKELREQMQNASAALDFERAAALRDTLRSLDATVKQRVRMAKTPEMQRQDARAGVEELQRVLHLPCVPHTIEAFDISNVSGTHAVAGMVCFVDGLPHRQRYRRFRIRTVSGIDDPAMMGEVVQRRFRRLQEESGARPDLVLVDGGPIQLRSARGAMDACGADAVPAAGLAKRFEEIYLVGQKKPVRLPRDSKALQVLQRMRDEAHRFALTYHRGLRGRRIRESVLDEIPGIGDKRKELLLRHFGSVRRLAGATVDELAAVPGVGRQMARAIQAVLSGEVEGPLDAAPQAPAPESADPAVDEGTD